MAEDAFYRVEITGERIPVSFATVHQLRKDVLLYFDENIGERVVVLLAEAQYQLPYWQFISIGFEQEWAESARYKTLVEEGCLALLHGISLDLLDEPIGLITRTWQTTPVDTILLYLRHYQPQTTRLQTAKSHLLRAYEFISAMTYADLDSSGCLLSFSVLQAGEWFDQEIVQQYYQNQISTFGLR